MKVRQACELARKASEVVRSCQTAEQLLNARKYLSYFERRIDGKVRDKYKVTLMKTLEYCVGHTACFIKIKQMSKKELE
jgi:hypothetical protein